MTHSPDVLTSQVELYWDRRRKRGGVRPSLGRSEHIGVQEAASGYVESAARICVGQQRHVLSLTQRRRWWSRGGSREKEQGTTDEREPTLREHIDRRMRRDGEGRGGECGREARARARLVRFEARSSERVERPPDIAVANVRAGKARPCGTRSRGGTRAACDFPVVWKRAAR
ncbi:hypothetical protein DFH08DRAFT_942791 [Mycena albidolilacea]|uniref:Uncharacterized protein n=1 Tax=Mycena albidolilacea TaxID=1033008 RepID=A0AAD6ZCE7_9AGAR|nr:hypothetical protein DFH08DRAFT_942791 [Mycena albidolilacea]